MRILYIGCVESSYRLLKILIACGADIVGVITKKESKENADFADLGELCRQNYIEHIYVKNVNDVESLEFVKKVKPDIGFCFGWSQLVHRELLQSVKMGMIGFHPAALPQNKGRHPIIWTLVLGLKETASTFFFMDETADSGVIVSQVPVRVAYEDDATTLYEKIMKTAEIQVKEIYEKIEAHILCHTLKENYGGNTWRKRGRSDGEIDWRMSGYAIYNLVRGLTKPYVGAHFMYHEKEYKVWKVQEIKDVENIDNIEPGKVLAVYEDGRFDVKVYDEVIRILECDPISVFAGEYLQ